MDYIQPYLDFFGQNPQWAIAIVFLIAFGEALLIVGLFVPSTAVLVGAGMLVGTGHLGFWPVFLATAAGAIVGDQVSYWAGRLYGETLKAMWPLNHYPGLVARGEDYVRAHGGKSIALGRFVPGVKAVVPGIVGMFGMGQVKFASVNFSSGLVWAGMHVFPGMLLGQGLAMAGELSGRLVVVLLALLVILGIGGWLIRLGAAGAWPFIDHALGQLSAWARARPSKAWRRFGRAVAPDNPRSILVLFFAAFAVAGLLALIEMTVGIFARGAFLNADLSINRIMLSLRNAPADELMTAITMLGDGVVLLAVGATMVLWLVWRRAWRAAVAVAATIMLSRLFVPVIKFWTQTPRPIDLHGGVEAYGFPAGHTTLVTVIFGVLAVLVSHSMGRWGRAVIFSFCALAVIAIAYSRIYLGVHWTSDVLGGFLFGAVMTAAFGVAIEAVPPRRIQPVGLFGAAMLAFLLVGILHVGAGYSGAAERYAPRRDIAHQTQAGWQAGGWSALPRRRIDLAGKPEEPFAAQWLGDLGTLKALLQRQGWKPTDRWTWSASLPYLDPNRGLDDLAPRPALHQGLKADLTLTRSIPGETKQRLALRLWKADVEVDGRPLYLVSLTREALRHGWSLYAIPAPRPAEAEELAGLVDLFKSGAGAQMLALEETEDGGTQALVRAYP